MKTSDRRGFTLVELMIVAVLGAMVVAATYQVLVVNQRTYTAQTAQVRGQQTVRAGMEVLFGELRELSSGEGDILAFGGDTLKVRAMRRFGLVCSVNLALGSLRVMKVGSWFEPGDSVVIYEENSVATDSDDDWLYATVTAVDTTQSCGSQPAQQLLVPAVTVAAAAGDTVRTGSNLRSYMHYTYGLYTVDGEPYLARSEPGSGLTPLVGPLAANKGLEFRYLDTLGATATALADIAQVELTLRTQARVRGPDGAFVSDSIKTRIFARN